MDRAAQARETTEAPREAPREERRPERDRGERGRREDRDRRHDRSERGPKAEREPKAAAPATEAPAEAAPAEAAMAPKPEPKPEPEQADPRGTRLWVNLGQADKLDEAALAEQLAGLAKIERPLIRAAEIRGTHTYLFVDPAGVDALIGVSGQEREGKKVRIERPRPKR
jgi:hypothetical protein